MKSKKLSIRIRKPISTVFSFLLNPENTPLWVDSIVYEETSGWPVKNGTIFRNKNTRGEWNEYTLINFRKNKTFELVSKDKNYHVRYDFNMIVKNETELLYFEWMVGADLIEPFTIASLKKLKIVLENSD